MAESQIDQWLQQGIAAARAGRREQAQRLLMQVVEADEQSETAWLWLSSVVETDQDRLICLENVLTLNPDNAQARAGLDWLRQQDAAAPEDKAPFGPAGPAATAEPEVYPFAESDYPAPASAPPVDQPPRIVPSDGPDGFLEPDGCAYCGRSVDVEAKRCPHCGGNLWFSPFSREKTSATTPLSISVCVALAFLNLGEWYLIGLLSRIDLDNIRFFRNAIKYVIGRTVYNPDSFEGFLSGTQVVQLALTSHLVMGGLFVLVTLGLMLRLAPAHGLGLVVSVTEVAISVLGALTLGVWGWLNTLLRTTFAAVLTVFLIQSVEDFSRDSYRLNLELDRRPVNAADYYSRGRFYQQQGIWAKALVHYLKAAALTPHYDTYQVAVARSYYNLDRYDQATKAINRAIEVSRTPAELEPLRQQIIRTRQSQAEE